MHWAYTIDETPAACPLEQVPQRLRAAGCERAELAVAAAPPVWTATDIELVSLTAAAQEATNLAAADEDARREAIDWIERLIETAQTLNVPTIRLTPAQVGPPGGAALCRYEDAELWAFDGLCEIALAAERCGVHVAVTGAAGGFALSPTEHRRFVDRIGSGWIGACLDLAAVARVGDPIDWQRTLGARTLLTVVDAAAVRPESLCPQSEDAVVVLTGPPESAAAFIAAVETESADG